jgi:hypothetical protein
MSPARKPNRLLWWAALLVTGAAIGPACSAVTGPAPESEPTPAGVPAACELLSDETVASLVGPALPVPVVETAATAAGCLWSFQADTSSYADEIRRPSARWLSVLASRGSALPCNPLDVVRDGRMIGGVGRTAAIGVNRELADDEITYCRDDNSQVSIMFRSLDSIGVRREGLSHSQAEATLLRLAQETDRRWAQAPLAPQPPVTATSEPATVVDPCGLVAATTTGELGVTAPTPHEESGGEPSSAPELKALRCDWSHEAAPVLKHLAVTVVEFADRGGHDAAAWADVHVEQWATGWTARELTGLGARAAVATDNYSAVVWTAHSTSAIKVEFHSETLVTPGTVAPQATGELEATAERVAREVVANLPR